MKSALFSGGVTPFSLTFALKCGETVALREIQQEFVFNEAAFIERQLALADQCQLQN